ncbi:hypothetical protein KR038_011916 [Drosophila bunnanda]|nr:hypothetical protein KR038_011916 [Drosophila bunnanda]
MRSIAFAVVIFAGVLACSSAAPQLSRFDLGWLDAILREAGQRNNTVRFGNNTVIISGVSNAQANANDGTIRPSPPQNQWPNPWFNNRYPYNNGYYYYRTLPTENGVKIVEVPVSSSEESQEVAYDISGDQSEEDVYHQEDQTVEEDEEDEELNEAEDELDEEPEDAEEATNEEADEVEDEVIDPEEEAVDAELEVIEKELIAKESN